MKKSAIALIYLMSTATSAGAWGDREQGALAGFAASQILNSIQNNRSTENVYQEPIRRLPSYQPRYIYNAPVLTPSYTHQIIFDPMCQCYRQILVQNGWQ